MVQYVQSRCDASFAALSDATQRGILEQLGRARTRKLGLRRLEVEAAWIERPRQLWIARFDVLDKVVEELNRKEKSMDERKESESAAMKNRTTAGRRSERELVVTRSFNAPARIVYEAWTKPELFMRWWTPKSMGMSLLSCEMDVRVGGGYRLGFGHAASEKPMEFFGKYIEVIPHTRLAWTNDESDDGAVTTVTFEEKGGKTLLVFHELYPSKEALDASIEGMEGCMPEQFEQLDELLVSLGASASTLFAP
jgi:uncharacterized protein YndB with AHSA1/START domain